MAAKYITFIALVAAARSSVVPAAGDDGAYTSFSYDVADPISGDYKSQAETRSGGVVRGQYSLLESDGTKRTVDYAADALNGFNAVVRKDPAVVAAAAAVVAAPTAYAARNIVNPALAAAAPATYAAQIVAAPGLVSTAPAAYAARSIITPGILTGAPATYAARATNSPAAISTAPAVYAAQTVLTPAVVPKVVSVAAAPAVAVTRSYAPIAYSSRLIASSNYNSAPYW